MFVNEGRKVENQVRGKRKLEKGQKKKQRRILKERDNSQTGLRGCWTV